MIPDFPPYLNASFPLFGRALSITVSVIVMVRVIVSVTLPYHPHPLPEPYVGNTRHFSKTIVISLLHIPTYPTEYPYNIFTVQWHRHCGPASPPRVLSFVTNCHGQEPVKNLSTTCKLSDRLVRLTVSRIVYRLKMHSRRDAPLTTFLTERNLVWLSCLGMSCFHHNYLHLDYLDYLDYLDLAPTCDVCYLQNRRFFGRFFLLYPSF